MNAEIISIGDEITSGQLLDTNAQWLSQRLEEMGIRVLFHTTVGDELEPNVDVFRTAIERADLVIATGGLGPTADDLTREALARATGRELLKNDEALEYIRGIFAWLKRPMPPQNELQALFPVGSRPILNPHGTAPGIDLEVPRTGRTPSRVLCLPGVPAEVYEMWTDSVASLIDCMVGHQRRVIRRRLIHCFGAGESQIESMLPDMIRRGRSPTVGITAGKATITLRIAAEGATEAECLAAMEPTVATIYQCLGTLIFGEGDDRLQDAVIRRLAERGQTLATAEWGTCGLLSQWLAETADASVAYRGGSVLCDRPDAEAVVQMAIEYRRRMAADYGLAIGPIINEAENPDSQPVTIALATADGVQQKTIPFRWHPALGRIYCAKQALNLLRLSLLG